MISKDTAGHYVWGERCDGWHLVNTPALSVIQERMPAGASEQKHMHAKARQFFFVLSGSVTMEIDGKREVLNGWHGLEVAPGVPHRIFNDSSHVAEFIVVSQPHAHGDRFLSDEEK